MFAAGTWLSGSPSTRLARLGHQWAAVGRMRLEERVRRLVASDGSFSQYSTNYHRVLVDTLSYAEFWRRECGAPPFSDAFYRKGRAAIAWLSSMVDSISGDVPNIGANDGARLFRLTETSYRDFRPSVQLASSLFNGQTVYARGDWDEALRRLSVTAISGQGEKTSKVYTDGGYAVFVASDRQSWGVLRFPKFRFRPSHADALHLDLWCNGTNLVRDGGTYSYHLSEPLGPYFSGTASHSTCQFDERDQMPRLGRFLFGNWLATEELSELSNETNQTCLSASYVDSLGACHCREVRVTTGSWEIVDEMKITYKKNSSAGGGQVIHCPVCRNYFEYKDSPFCSTTSCNPRRSPSWLFRPETA